MRLRGWMGLGALVMGAVACGDSVGPPAVQGRDLEFTAPAVKSQPLEQTSRAWDDPVTPEEEARARAMHEAMLADGEAAVPWIFDSYVLGEWDRERFRMQLGMFALGTSYEMTGAVQFTDVNGRQTPGETVRRTEDGPLYTYMRPHVEQWYSPGSACGTDAAMHARFTAYSKLPILGSELARAEQTKSGISVQARCQAPSTTTGGGGVTYTSNGFKTWLCFYEVWTDFDGDVIAVFFFGCTEVSGTTYAA